MNNNVDIPLVSIIIPVYNQEKYIQECVESVLSQTYKNLEIIVIDDGSTDATPEILKKYRGRIKYVRQKNQGPAVALNKGLHLAKGLLVGWLGSDDIYLPHLIELQVKKFQEDPSLSLIYTDYIIINSEGKELKVVKCPSPSTEQFAKILIENNFINGSTVVMKKECHEKVGYYDTTLKASMDADMWFRLLGYGYKFGHIPIPLVKYRWHPHNISHRFKLMQEYRDKVYLKAFKIFFSQGLLNNPKELEKLAFVFAKNLCPKSALEAIKKSSDIENKISIRRIFLRFLYKIMNSLLVINLMVLILKIRNKIKQMRE